MDVLVCAHPLEDIRPHGDTDLSKMCFLEEKHKGAGLPNATPYAEGDLVFDNCLVVWELKKIKLTGNLQW